jgi:hypothetical protein
MAKSNQKPIAYSDYKIAVLDIENAPNLGFVWDKYEQNVLSYEREWFMLSYAWKWYGKKNKVQCLSLPDFTGYKKNKYDDSKLIDELWYVFDEADMIVWHNGWRFDRRKSNTRFLWNDLAPYSLPQSFDTLTEARDLYKFNSNKLGDLAEFLGYPGKIKHHGIETWLGCYYGDMAQWDIMTEYNAHDVVMNEWVYDEIKPWSKRHPNVALATGKSGACRVCGRVEYMHIREDRPYRRLKSFVADLWHCDREVGGCGAYSTGKRVKDPNLILQG